jgi:peptide-methionine (S)-S-oxide reductase|tara:strand:- start:19 stop:633 length:615 start_codon:yes stop_codon:yes gene_type:complete
MKKFILLFIVLFNFNLSNVSAGVLSITTADEENKFKKVYFAGGCFWCMEESFDKVKGVMKSISGYSGGHVKNPTYKQVIYKDTGHVEAIAVYYDPKLTSYEELLKVFWANIDPFDANGQFCDKGKSYRSVVFYQNIKQRKLIENSIINIEKRFNKKKIVTLVWKFEKFYPAEDYHQDYYQNNFLRYLAYKTSCQREEILNKIWN